MLVWIRHLCVFFFFSRSYWFLETKFTVYEQCMHCLHTMHAQFTYWIVRIVYVLNSVHSSRTVYILFIYYAYTVHAFKNIKNGSKNIKNGSQGTIYTFKNYFTTMFSVSVIISSIHIKETSQCRWVKKKKKKKIIRPWNI